MTIKSLEPELTRLSERQQKELQHLKNLHKVELDEAELKATVRNSQMMDQLRLELTKEKEKAIERELADLRAK